MRRAISLAVSPALLAGVLLFSAQVPVPPLVVGAGPGGSPQVAIFDHNGAPLGSFLAYDASFTGGVNVAAGDTDGDGVFEIITGPRTDGSPEVRLFDTAGAPTGHQR